MIFTAQTSIENTSSKLSEILTWTDKNFSGVAYILIVLLAAIIGSKLVANVLGRLLHRTVRTDMFPTTTDRDRRLRTLTSISTAVSTFVVWAIATIMILNKLGVNTAPLLASAGILSVAFGFGAQSLVRDFVTGIFIIAENQYRVGDYVEIQNVRGTVITITMRTTVIQDDDGAIFHVPNGSIIVTGNRTMNNNKVSIELSVSSETDIDLFCKIANRVGMAQTKNKEIADLIVEPIQFKRILNLESGNVTVRMTGKVKDGAQITVRSAYYLGLQKELFKNKIALK